MVSYEGGGADLPAELPFAEPIDFHGDWPSDPGQLVPDDETGGDVPLDAVIEESPLRRPPLERFVIDSSHPHPLDVLQFPTIPREELPNAFETPDALREGVRRLAASENRPEDWLNRVDYAVDHEVEHRRAAALVAEDGSDADCFFATEGTSDGFSASVVLSGVRTTRLGHAVISAAPKVPSHTDTLKFRSHGFANTRDVALTARVYGMALPQHLARWKGSTATTDKERIAAQLLFDRPADVSQRDYGRQAMLYAFANAQDLRQHRAMSVPGDLTNPYETDQYGYSARPADPHALVTAPDWEDLVVPHGTIIVPQYADPARAFKEIAQQIDLGQQATQSLSVPLGPSEFLEMTRREAERIVIAETVGYRGQGLVSFTLGYNPETRQDQYDMRYLMPGIEVTPLEAAIINVGVTNPSPANLAAMRELGFNSVEDVALAAYAMRITTPGLAKVLGLSI